MIREDNAQAAIDMSEELDKMNLGVSPKEASILATLHAATVVDFVRPSVVPEAGYTPDATEIMSESMIVPLGSDRSAHDIALETIVVEVSDAVKQHLSFTKNTVRPIVQDLVERLNVALQAMPEQATFNPNVMRVDLPEPMLVNSFEELVQGYESKSYVEISNSLLAPNQEMKEVLELLHTGNKLMDTEIDIWVGKLGQDYIYDIYRSVFGTGNVSSNMGFSYQINKLETGVDAALVGFLIGRKLIDSPPKGVNATLSQWKRSVGEIIEQSGLRLSQAYVEKDRQVKSGQMLLSYTKETARVLAPVYDAWVDKGANVATLFGNLLTDRPSLYADAIDENAVELLALWQKHNILLTGSLQANKYRDTIRLLKFHTEAVAADHLAEIFNPINTVPVTSLNAEVARFALNNAFAFIDSLTSEDLVNMWCVATEIVAGKFFYYTDSLKILQGIEKACTLNPDIEPNEAALLSTIEYVTDFFVDQLHVHDL